MVEGARLESVYTGNGIAGSNPALSAFARLSFMRRRALLFYTAGFGGHGPRKFTQWPKLCATAKALAARG